MNEFKSRALVRDMARLQAEDKANNSTNPLSIEEQAEVVRVLGLDPRRVGWDTVRFKRTNAEGGLHWIEWQEVRMSTDLTPEQSKAIAKVMEPTPLPERVTPAYE